MDMLLLILAPIIIFMVLALLADTDANGWGGNSAMVKELLRQREAEKLAARQAEQESNSSPDRPAT